MGGNCWWKGRTQMINKNPFSNNRAEYMADVWKFYVPFGELNTDDAKPLIIEGGRGTGKTMFFLCNSWRAMCDEYSFKSSYPIKEILEKKHIGIYYKVDPSFVAAMSGSNRKKEEWESIFGTYLSTILTKELISFLIEAQKEQLVEKNHEKNIAKKYSNTFRGKEDVCQFFDEIVEDIDKLINDIEDVVNNPEWKIDKFRQTRVGNGTMALIEEILKGDCFKEISIRIYIDEYESLTEWQQKIINTLIKTSNKKIIYNIGMKPGGMKTYSTLAAEEQLQETHDYKFIKIDDLLQGEEYKKAVLEICKKRLELFEEREAIKLQNTDIRSILGDSDVSKEISILEKKSKPKFYERLEEIIRAKECKDIENAVEELCTNAPLINARLHLALLMRKNYAPKVDNLLANYLAWCNKQKNVESDAYAEWMHNAKNGIVFLLAKECHVKKMYYGLEMFLALSSGTIRYFLELCEQTINIALREGFDWKQKESIDIRIQSRAAHLVSKKKIMEIESYAEYGRRLRIFTQCLGELFQELHRNEKLTLAEPEPNHFSANSLQLTDELKKHLDCAVQWSVLQVTPSTKEKENIKTNVLDYHLNKIYAPYFEISCFRKRKIKLSPEELQKLFSCDMNKAQEAVKDFLKLYWGKRQSNVKDYKQMSLFGEENTDES